MSLFVHRRLSAAALSVLAAFSAACGSDSTAGSGAAQTAASRRDDGDSRPYATTSVTPALVKSLVTGVEITPVLSSDDVLPGSPNFVFGGSADGAGLLRNNDGTYTFLVNNEDNFATARVTFDKNFAPVKGDYVLNSTAGLFRLCSATLATPEEHGFGPLFLTAGESGAESQIHAVNPYGAPNTSKLLTALGQWSAENAVPLPKYAYPGKTVIIIGDDDSGVDGGQIAIYVADQVGDLENGKLYVLARTDNDLIETNIKIGQKIPVEFRLVPDQKTLRAGGLNAEARRLQAIPFGRVEDMDYRKRPKGELEFAGFRRESKSVAFGREIYFNVTGQPYSGTNAGKTRTKYGRTYKLVLDKASPLTGSLELVLDGDDKSSPAGLFQDVDNIYVGTNYAYIQEDPNGYGDETHDSYIYQYNLTTGELKPIIAVDPRRDQPDAAKYNGATPSRFGAWEFGALIDVSRTLKLRGERGRGRGFDDDDDNEGTFLLAVQPHTWVGDKYKNADGGTLRPNENQASQIVLVRGLPR